MKDSERLSVQANISFRPENGEDEAINFEVAACSDNVTIEIDNGYVRTSPNYKAIFSWDTMTLDEAKAIASVLNHFIECKN